VQPRNLPRIQNRRDRVNGVSERGSPPAGIKSIGFSRKTRRYKAYPRSVPTSRDQTKIVFNGNGPLLCLSLLKVDEVAQERVHMKGLPMTVHRRDLLRFGIVFTAAAASAAVATNAMTVEPTGSASKRKARYRANSVEVQNFYRVNRYPAK
jgi:hypothetical protein